MEQAADTIDDRVGAMKYYLSPTAEAIEECSVYTLLPEERLLLSKYLRKGDRIADLACGMGRTTLCLYEMGYEVVGMDLSYGLIRAAQKRFPYLDLRPASFTQIPEPDSSFSFVLISRSSIDLASSDSERIAAIRECARVLKPGGRLIFSCHNLKALHFFSPRHWRRPLWKMQYMLKAFRGVAHIAEDGFQALFLSPEEVRRQTENNGFRFLEMVGSGTCGSGWRTRYGSKFIHFAFERNEGAQDTVQGATAGNRMIVERPA